MRTPEKNQVEVVNAYDDIPSVPFVTKDEVIENVRRYREELFPDAAIQNPPLPAPVAPKASKM